MKKIGYCSCGKLWENPDTQLCGSCARLDRKAASIQPSDNNSAIESRSVKGKEVDRKYLNRLRTWKRGKKCEGYFAHECVGEITCHHMAGRGTGFYDEYAEENNIPLTLDERLWKPLCLNAHQYVTDHPIFAWENQYSFKRVTDPIFIKP